MSKSGQPERIGRYEIRGLLGEGTMGTVYRAHDPWIDRAVAIKVCKIHFGGPVEEQRINRERVLAEARAAGRLDHPNIVRILDCAEDDNGDPYIVMEYLAGPSLATVMRDYKVRQEDALRILEQLSAAVDAAHAQGVVHHDIKPANVLFNEEGDIAKIADFGIARIDDSRATQDMRRPATPAYMAPEQATGGVTDKRSDLFSFGVMVYELLAGRPPYAGGNVVSLAYQVVHEPPPPITEVADLPASVDAVMSRILDKNPERRYGTAGEFYEALKRALFPGGLQPTESLKPCPAPKVSEPAPAIRPSRHVWTMPRRLPWIASGAVLLAVIGWALWPDASTRIAPGYEPPGAAGPAAPPVQAVAAPEPPVPPVKHLTTPRRIPAPTAQAQPMPKPTKMRPGRLVTPPVVQRTADNQAVLPEPVLAEPVPAPVPVAVAPGHLAVKLRHRINGGTLRLLVDGRTVLREEFSKRRLDLVKITQWPALDIEPGSHQITAHVMGTKGKTYASEPFTLQVKSGQSAAIKIQIHDDKLDLLLE